MRARIGLVVSLLLVVAACGDDDGATTSAVPPTSATATTGAPGTTDATGTTSATPAAPPASSALAESFGLETIEVLTPESGGGERPDFAWTAVDGATSYQVTLLAPDGTFYWGWDGDETSVPLGGFPRLVPAATGPRLVSGMSWTVMAFDAEFRPIAAGGPNPIGP